MNCKARAMLSKLQPVFTVGVAAVVVSQVHAVIVRDGKKNKCPTRVSPGRLDMCQCLREHIERELQLQAPLRIMDRTVLERINELLIWCRPLPHSPEKCMYLQRVLEGVVKNPEVPKELADALKKYCARRPWPVDPPL